MKIIRARHLGMCFGVRDAIALALRQSAREPVTILGELVHNETVNADLRKRGVEIQTRLEAVATLSVMITAHGASERTRRWVKERGFQVTEATCPLVQFAHDAIRQLVRDGFHPVIIGKRDHVEVRGMTDDLAEYDVVLDADDVLSLARRPRYGIAAQTTQPMERVEQLVKMIRQRFPQSEVRFTDTVCQSTKLRQIAAIELARQCDVVVVIGGARSNNTRELAETCGRFCDRTFHVQSAADLNPAWLHHAETVGITAGTSTPDHVIDEVEQCLVEWTQKVQVYEAAV
ncbi:MAG: 4-hydroxy-3-methylbut-2-enyl diphosphate reductase [Verrucomicrobia bacterium]|nr:4-hydroxy-3-methylbut-2-enyl diphosphate reductase [Verrucomicrobiota bacterium]